MEAKQDEVIKTINSLRQELTSHRQSTTDSFQFLQRTIFDLETLQRNHAGNWQEDFYDIRGVVLERTERIENMMVPLLPTTRREQVILHAADESPVNSGESTGSESSTQQIIATQHQLAELHRELEEARELDDEQRQIDIANMIEQLEIEVDQEREQRRAFWVARGNYQA